MLELTIYGIGFFLCTLLIRYMLFKVRKNHNHGPNSVWVGIEQLWCCVWSALSIIRLNILRQYWDLSVRMRLGRRLAGIKNIKNIEEKNE